MQKPDEQEFDTGHCNHIEDGNQAYDADTEPPPQPIPILTPIQQAL